MTQQIEARSLDEIQHPGPVALPAAHQPGELEVLDRLAQGRPVDPHGFGQLPLRRQLLSDLVTTHQDHASQLLGHLVSDPLFILLKHQGVYISPGSPDATS